MLVKKNSRFSGVTSERRLVFTYSFIIDTQFSNGAYGYFKILVLKDNNACGCFKVKVLSKH